jgi:hypothetical protein
MNDKIVWVCVGDAWEAALGFSGVPVAGGADRRARAVEAQLPRRGRPALDPIAGGRPPVARRQTDHHRCPATTGDQ